MKCGNSNDVVHKEVVVVGNGPSGIVLSYMLSGKLPILTSKVHPDAMLSARLKSCSNQNLLQQNFGFLASGLEGRSTNPVSLLLDALLHPCADIGSDLERLVEFRDVGVEIDHIVIGKGPPGGSWHRMDPNIRTLSLANWMALPSLPFGPPASEKQRALAKDVAEYYVRYVKEMQLERFFVNNTSITKVTYLKPSKRGNWVNKINSTQRVQLCVEPEKENVHKTCIISSAINYILRGNRKQKCCKKTNKQLNEKDQSPNKFNTNNHQKSNTITNNRSMSFGCDSINVCDNFNEDEQISFNSRHFGNSLNYNVNQVPSSDCDPDWLIETFDMETGKTTTYSSKYLILANGVHDLPNKLDLSNNNPDPQWLFHDLRSFEYCLDRCTTDKPDPVLIVGAGLSAADAVIASRRRKLSVIHVFRNRSTDLNKQLPENMYPEYHEVHQMMKGGGSAELLYQPCPEYTLTHVDEANHIVEITSKAGDVKTFRVSCAVVLIGSKPDLSFLPQGFLNVTNDGHVVDDRAAALNIDKFTHLVKGFHSLFAIGPLAGDFFVRFIPGGALAVVAEIYRQNSKKFT